MKSVVNCYARYVDLTPEMVADMRRTLDIYFGFWNESAQAELQSATDDEVVEYIAKNYDGGVRGFCQDAGYAEH